MLSMTGLPAGSIGVRSEAESSVGYGVTLLDFRGTGVSTITTPSAGIITINITGGGGGGGGTAAMVVSVPLFLTLITQTHHSVLLTQLHL